MSDLEKVIEINYTEEENEILKDVKHYYPIIHKMMNSYILDTPTGMFYHDLSVVSSVIGEDATEVYIHKYSECNNYKK